MKHRSQKMKLGRPQAEGHLIGRIVAANISAELDDFAVILQETPKTVVLAHLAKEQTTGRPLLKDGQVAANALIKVFRATVGRVVDTMPPQPAAPLLASLRLDEKFFSHRVRPMNPKAGEVLVEVIRVNKLLSPGCPLGPVSFPCKRYRCCYYLWDIHDK